MVSIEDVQEALVAHLKADVPLDEVVGDEIRESRWQGVDFTYPMVRVAMYSMAPWHPGTCANRLTRAKFDILTFSEDASSLEANQIAGLVIAALHLENLSGTGWRSGRIRLSPRGQSAAVRVSERVWRTETKFEVNVYGEA